MTIGFLIPDEVSPYHGAYTKAVQEAAPKLGVNAVILSANGSASTQLSQMKELIARRVNGIVFWPAVAGASLPDLLAAKQANIPVDISNSIVVPTSSATQPGSLTAYYHTYTGTNDYTKGESQGKLVAEALHGHGNVVEILGQPGYEPTTNIFAGMKAYLAKNAPGIKVLAAQPGNWVQNQAETATANLISRYGSQINGVVAEDDIMAAGAAQAIAAAHLKGKVKLIGEGYYTPTPALLKSGAETLTQFQSPCWDGVMALRTIIKVANGQSTPKAIYMPVPPVTKSSSYKPFGCLPGVQP